MDRNAKANEEPESKIEDKNDKEEMDIKNIKKNIKNFYPYANEGLVDLCLKAVYENPNKIDSVTEFVWRCNNLLKEERSYIHTGQSGSLKSTRIALENAGMIEWVGGFLSLTDKGKSLTWRQRKESEKRKTEEDFKKRNDIYNAEWKYLKQKDIDYRKSVKDKIMQNEYNAEWKYLKQKDIENKKLKENEKLFEKELFEKLQNCEKKNQELFEKLQNCEKEKEILLSKIKDFESRKVDDVDTKIKELKEEEKLLKSTEQRIDDARQSDIKIMKDLYKMIKEGVRIPTQHRVWGLRCTIATGNKEIIEAEQRKVNSVGVPTEIYEIILVERGKKNK